MPRAELPAPGASPLELFLALVRIASPTQHEGALAAAIGRFLDAAGVAWVVDDAARVTGSDTGNLIARVRRGDDRPTVLLVAHLDTVQPVGSVVEPVVADGVVRSAGETILGADNKAAVAAVLSVLASGAADHANVIVAFTTGEERGVMGVTALGPVAAEADLAFPVDGSSPVGTVFEGALGQTPWELRVRGRSAHAAKAPADGRHAVAAAARVVTRLALGWADDALLNVGEISGGGPSNVVPAHAVVHGEARAFTPELLSARLEGVRAVADAAARETETAMELVLRPEDGAPPFPPSAGGAALQIARAAAADVGLPLRPERIEATLEANFLSGMGLPTLGIASGGRGPHSVEESLPVAELDRLVGFLDALLRRAAGGATPAPRPR